MVSVMSSCQGEAFAPPPGDGNALYIFARVLPDRKREHAGRVPVELTIYLGVKRRVFVRVGDINGLA